MKTFKLRILKYIKRAYSLIRICRMDIVRRQSVNTDEMLRVYD